MNTKNKTIIKLAALRCWLTRLVLCHRLRYHELMLDVCLATENVGPRWLQNKAFNLSNQHAKVIRGLKSREAQNH